MKSLYDFIIEPVGDRYANEIKIEDSSLVLNTKIETFQFVNRLAKVIETPIAFTTPIKKGDIIVVHQNIFRRFYDMQGKPKNSRSYFKDNMYFAAVQHGSSEYGQGLTSQSGPGIWSAQHFLKASYPWDMEPQFPGANGENMVNGMEGFIVTDDTHTAAGGIRRWRVSNTNIATDLTYGNTNGKFYLHLSFLAPGVALHDGTWGMGDNKLHPGYTPYSYTTLHKYFQNIIIMLINV